MTVFKQWLMNNVSSVTLYRSIPCNIEFKNKVHLLPGIILMIIITMTLID
jgi:hypothetical protein